MRGCPVPTAAAHAVGSSATPRSTVNPRSSRKSAQAALDRTSCSAISGLSWMNFDSAIRSSAASSIARTAASCATVKSTSCIVAVNGSSLVPSLYVWNVTADSYWKRLSHPANLPLYTAVERGGRGVRAGGEDAAPPGSSDVHHHYHLRHVCQVCQVRQVRQHRFRPGTPDSDTPSSTLSGIHLRAHVPDNTAPSPCKQGGGWGEGFLRGGRGVKAPPQ